MIRTRLAPDPRSCTSRFRLPSSGTRISFGIGPDTGSGGVIDNIYVRVDRGDGIKPHDDMRVTNTYFDIDGTSGHADIAQFQGTTGWHFENVVMEYRGGPRGTITAHFFVQNNLCIAAHIRRHNRPTAGQPLQGSIGEPFAGGR